MEFRVLGPLGVVIDGQPVPLGSPKLRTVLAALLVDANSVVLVGPAHRHPVG